MNRKLVLGIAVALVATQAWAQDRAPKKIELKTTTDKATYALGVAAAMDLRQHLEFREIPVDADTLLRGFRDALSNGKLAVSDDDMAAALQAQEQDVIKRNAEAGEAFLANNKKKKDVVSLPSGLQYKVLKKGMGKPPGPTDAITVNVRGRFLNGKEFVSSYEAKEPFVTNVPGVIRGWQEALSMMAPGSKWELYIPPDLAFGMGTPTIPPNATVVYELELLAATKPPAAAPRGKPQSFEDIK